MTSIHPRWHATDSDSHEEQPVRIVHAAPKKEQRSTPSVASKSVSRRPAAMVGIALTAMIGFAMVQGITTLRGALTSSTGTEVHLTKDGAVPPVITVMPGEQLTWINDDEIPHILSSDTLKMENGLLDSPAIFPGATYTETVAPDAAVKTHDYYSKTSSLVSGQVIVTAGNGTLPDPVSASSAGNTGVSSFSNTQIPVFGDQTSSAMVMAVSSSSEAATMETPSSAPSQVAMVLPSNPYTVGSAVQGPGYTPHASVLPITTNRPIRNAETGPGLWAITGLSLIGLYACTRKMFRRA